MQILIVTKQVQQQESLVSNGPTYGLIHFFATIYLIRYHTINSEKIFISWQIFEVL
jgi:hypothetical protein